MTAKADPPAEDGTPRARETTLPYGEKSDGTPGTVLTVGWIEQVLRLTLGDGVEVQLAMSGDVWQARARSRDLVRVISSIALHAREVMPRGGTLTVHAMNLDVGSGHGATRLGVSPGRYVFLGVSHTGRDDDAKADRGERPAGASVGLKTAGGLVADAGGLLKVDTRPGSGTAFNIYLPAA